VDDIQWPAGPRPLALGPVPRALNEDAKRTLNENAKRDMHENEKRTVNEKANKNNE